MPVKPMLDDVELHHIQKVEAEDQQVLAQHGVPALEGDFLQDLGRRVTRLTLVGVMTGPEAGEQLKTLRLKFRNAEPVSFVSDIATATTVEKVLIEEFGVRELAGKPARFEFTLTLREFLPPPAPEEEEPPPPPPEPPPPPVETGILIVEVTVEGDPNFDFSKVTLTVEGTKEDGSTFSQTLTNRSENIWTEDPMPLGQFTARAVVTDPPEMSGTAPATVRSGQTARAQINLRPGAIIATAFVVHFRFDNSFIEPCMREVLDQVAQHAADNPDQKLLIVGHTDKVGDDPPSGPFLYNQSLSERRARIVFAYLNFANNQADSEAEWREIRQRGIGEALPRIKDTWGARQYQYMLQSLGFYPGIVDGDHGPQTDDAVSSFRAFKNLPPGTTVNDDVWAALIHDYLAETSHTVPDAQFLRNAKDSCNGGTLKWLGCGEEDPLPLPQPSTRLPHRQYRRVELLFVRATQLSCEVPQPDTFNLPTAGAVNSTWCLGPGNRSRHCCFATRNCASPSPGQWCITPAETGSFVVRGSIRFEDGTPAANMSYILIAPDGEFMDGEVVNPPNRGEAILGHTRADGSFAYPSNPKSSGIYTMEIRAPFLARADDDEADENKGNVVCKRLDGSSDFNVILCAQATTFELQVTDAVRFGGATSTTFLATRAISRDVIITPVFPGGTCSAPHSIVWVGGAEVPGHPLRRRVPRDAIGQTPVTATLGRGPVTRSVEIFVVRLTLDVDADRDGVVQDEEAGRNTWDFGIGTRGAVILCNNDDDDSSGIIDNENTTIDGATDVDDLAPLIIRDSGPLPAGLSLELSVADQTKIRIFDQRIAAGTAIIGPAPLPAFVPITVSGADLELGMEGTQYPNTGFDGQMRLTLKINEGSTELARDEVLVRVAPWVMPSHLQVTQELYVVVMPGLNTAPDSTFLDGIQAAATAAGGIPLIRKPDTPTFDPWVQDCMEIGYARSPTKENNIVLNSIRREKLHTFARTLLAPDYGFVDESSPAAPTTFDSHGNLEVSPPVTVGVREFKLGRIYFGRGRPTEPFNPEVKAFLEAQLVQKPFEIDTDWLGVGHVDEVISFVPSTVGRPFRMLLANTDEAIRILSDLRRDGHGGLTLFTGKTHPTFGERTIDAILSDGTFRAHNTFCQTRLNGIETVMGTELGLSATDIIKIPALFAVESLFPTVFAALIPGMVNMLVITASSFSNHQLVVPKPFGPVLAGVDQLEKELRDRLTPLGYSAAQIRFVDDFFSYHTGFGEVHCGTNSKRRPHTNFWWEQRDH